MICISFVRFLKITTLIIDCFIVFSAIITKKTTNKLKIEILTNYYTRSFGAWEALGDLYDALENHGNQKKYYIYRALCKHMGTITENSNKKFVCEMSCKKTYSLYNEMNKNCYIKVLKRTKINEPLNTKYDDKIVIKFIVYKELFFMF